MSDDANTFAKQRRNFIALSLIVIFYHVGEISLDEINFFGTKIGVHNPDKITALIHIFFAYFAWRFCNIFYEISAWSKYICTPIRDFITKKTRPILLSEIDLDEDDPQYQLGGYPVLTTPNMFKYIFSYHILELHGHEYVHTSNHPDIISIEGWTLIKYRIYSLSEIFGKSIFLEYLFPFVLGFIAIISIFSTDFIQSILSFFVWDFSFGGQSEIWTPSATGV